MRFEGRRRLTLGERSALVPPECPMQLLLLDDSQLPEMVSIYVALGCHEQKPPLVELKRGVVGAICLVWHNAGLEQPKK